MSGGQWPPPYLPHAGKVISNIGFNLLLSVKFDPLWVLYTALQICFSQKSGTKIGFSFKALSLFAQTTCIYCMYWVQKVKCFMYWHSQVTPQGGIIVLPTEHHVYLLCWMIWHTVNALSFNLFIYLYTIWIYIFGDVLTKNYLLMCSESLIKPYNLQCLQCYSVHFKSNFKSPLQQMALPDKMLMRCICSHDYWLYID